MNRLMIDRPVELSVLQFAESKMRDWQSPVLYLMQLREHLSRGRTVLADLMEQVGEAIPGTEADFDVFYEEKNSK